MAGAATLRSDRPYSIRRVGLPLLAALLLADTVVLLGVDQAPVLLALALGGIAALWCVARSERALAFVVFGLPILDPVQGAAGDFPLSALVGRLLLAAPLALVFTSRLWALGAPDRPRVVRRLVHPAIGWASLLLLVYAWRLGSSPCPEYGTSKTWGYLVTNLTLLIAPVLLLAQPRGAESVEVRVRDFLFAALVAEAAIGVAGAINAVWPFYPWAFRLTTFGMNPIWFARHIGQALVLFSCFVACGWIRRSRALPWLLLLAVVFWLSGSRGVLAALVVAACVWLGSDARSRRWLPLAFMLGLGVLAVVMATLVIEGGESQTFFHRGASNFYRARLLDIALRTASEVGFFGVGTGGFGALAGVGDIRYYPHNILIEVGLENGLPGLLALLGFLTSTAIAAKRLLGGGASVQGRTIARIVLTLWAFNLANAMASGDVNVNEWIWLWAGVLLVLLP
ncbi:MAG: O-antigen ligase family protein [Candidatus Eisenbacteria bacterium]